MKTSREWEDGADKGQGNEMAEKRLAVLTFYLQARRGGSHAVSGCL